MTSKAYRPTGVLLLATVAVIVGLTDIVAGLGDIGIAGGFLSDRGFGDTIDGIMTGVGVALVAGCTNNNATEAAALTGLSRPVFVKLRGPVERSHTKHSPSE
jgi:hypothetical protein